MDNKTGLLLTLLLLLFGASGCVPSYLLTGGTPAVNPRTTSELDSGWVCANMKDAGSNGSDLSLTTHALRGWRPATVPGTVLTTLLNDSLIPDPFYGMNNEKIPDIYNTGRDYYTYWFVKDFHEAPPKEGEEVWLRFRGVNYGCDIYMNGHKVNPETHYGMYLRQTYNVTPYLSGDGDNRVAVIVYPPDPVGNPNGGQGGDGTIAHGVANQYVAGWDWIQPIRDRNTGIWDKVTLVRTGKVYIRYPHVITIVPGRRFPEGRQAPAIIRASMDVENPTNHEVSGIATYTIGGNTISEEISISPKTTRKVQFADYALQNPRLWWPNGYGQQPLYDVIFRFEDGGKTLDQSEVTTGIREIDTRWNSHTRSREVHVNGQKIFIKGADWITSDAMLRFSPERYDAEIRFHRDMNVNLIRIWGGSLTERPEFYAACDKYGILVFQDFWMSGDCNGKWFDPKKKDDQWTRRKYPDDHALFLKSVADQVRMLRNHPSLAFYCGGNEIPPPQDILIAMQDSLLPSLDSTRYFFTYSNVDSMSYNDLGGNGDGVYHIEPVEYFWRHRSYPFNSEIGSVGMGDYQSLERFIPPQDLVIPDNNWMTLDSVWRYHKYLGYGNHIEAYGTPSDLREYAEDAQLVNYDQYRGLMEGHIDHMWDWYTGVIIWKTQNPWTALRGQMYDYYLDPNAGLYGLHHANEALHVMYDPLDGMITIANHTFSPYHDVMVQVKAFDIWGQDSTILQWIVEISPTSILKIYPVKKVLDKLFAERGGFLSMRLIDSSRKVLSDNLYWFPDSTGRYSGLQQMGKASMSAEAVRTGDGRIAVTLRNPSGGPIAFFNRISLVDSLTRKRILPVFYSDNYVSVLPGEEKTVYIDPSDVKKESESAEVSVKGWNVATQYLEIR